MSAGANTRTAPGPVVLVIMDGVGVGSGDEFDAVTAAATPALDALGERGLYRTLRAHGEAVGLPSDSDMGNSEVGHNILGAGRIFDQGAKCVDAALTSGTIWGESWQALVGGVVGEGSRALHLIGLLSDGNVHSNLSQLEALIRRAADEGVPRLYCHVLLDGRDVPDRTAERYVHTLEEILADACPGPGATYAIASGGGRMLTTMDRYEADWSIVERGWRAHVLGDARRFGSAAQALEVFRAEDPDVSDQRLPAFVVASGEEPLGRVEDGDSVLVFNFRGDRMVQLCRAFLEDDAFDAFERERTPAVTFAAMVQYDGDLNLPPRYLVTPETVSGTISEYLAAQAVTQFACAETQKFGHVTYFWNGNRSGRFSDELETWLEVPSDTLPFEQRPWMKSAETADAVIQAIESGDYRFVRTNLAGGDMVGHTGNLTAARLAVEAVDLAVGRIASATWAAGGALIVTADHGNADDMVERDNSGAPQCANDGRPKMRTSHSLNPVPFYFGAAQEPSSWALVEGLNHAGLANVAATVVALLDLPVPDEYEPSLLFKR